MGRASRRKWLQRKARERGNEWGMRVRGGICQLSDGSWSVMAEMWTPDGELLEIHPQDGSDWPTFDSAQEAEAFYVEQLRPAIQEVQRSVTAASKGVLVDV